MGLLEWNPQVDQVINKFDAELSDEEIAELVSVCEAHFHDPFLDPYAAPVWFGQIEYHLNKELREKINGFKKEHEVDSFGWDLS